MSPRMAAVNHPFGVGNVSSEIFICCLQSLPYTPLGGLLRCGPESRPVFGSGKVFWKIEDSDSGGKRQYAGKRENCLSHVPHLRLPHGSPSALSRGLQETQRGGCTSGLRHDV